MNSTDNSDLSEREFQESQSSDDFWYLSPAPKDFTEVSPEAIGVRVKLDAVADFVKTLKGQDVEVSLSSLAVTCDSYAQASRLSRSVPTAIAQRG